MTDYFLGEWIFYVMIVGYFPPYYFTGGVQPTTKLRFGSGQDILLGILRSIVGSRGFHVLYDEYWGRGC
jgi:hypothetical protein